MSTAIVALVRCSMRNWTGTGVFQWENTRTWNLNNSSEFSKLDGALVLPGFSSLSVFFRRQVLSSTNASFTLRLYTAPLYTKLLDDDVTTANVAGLMYGPLAMLPANGLALSNAATTAAVFGAKISNDQPMGSVLFWEMNQSAASPYAITGDIYVVPTYTGSAPSVTIQRAMDMQMGGGQGGGQGYDPIRRSR